MQALLDSFIQEINKIDDAGELRRLLMALKKEQIVKIDDEDPGVDYAAEYRKQTGRDLETGEYVTQ